MNNPDKASIKANLSSTFVELTERQCRVKHLFQRRMAVRNMHPSETNEQHAAILARYDEEIMAEQAKIEILKANITGLEAALR
jgi:hypothetical protein